MLSLRVYTFSISSRKRRRSLVPSSTIHPLYTQCVREVLPQRLQMALRDGWKYMSSCGAVRPYQVMSPSQFSPLCTPLASFSCYTVFHRSSGGGFLRVEPAGEAIDVRSKRDLAVRISMDIDTLVGLDSEVGG